MNKDKYYILDMHVHVKETSAWPELIQEIIKNHPNYIHIIDMIQK